MKTTTLPFRLSQNESMRVFREQKNVISRDILRIGFSIFNLEKQLKDGKSILCLRIPLSMSGYVQAVDSNLKQELEILVNTILGKNVVIDFVPADSKIKKSRIKKKYLTIETLCLFSGGVDSFVGIVESKKIYPETEGVFIAHSDQASVINIVRNIIMVILKGKKINCHTIHVPAIRGKKKGYSQLRGFLYVVSAGALSEIVNSKRIIVTECGPTMYQPKFGLYDSVTHTTDPLVLEVAKKVIVSMRQKDVEIIKPFENLTKAEVISIYEPKNEICQTYSCIRGMFRKHCGTCYGCMLRRTAEIIFDVDNTFYSKDIFGDENVDYNNFLSLLNFSYNLVFNEEELKEYSLYKIKKYSKRDLFVKQAWDIFSSLYLLKKRGYRLSSKMEKAYEIYIKDIDEKEIKKHLDTLMKSDAKPNFSKRVN